MKKNFFIIVMIYGFTTNVWSQETKSNLISLSDSIGTEIDKTEQERFHLFPDIKGFESAQIIQFPNMKYQLNYIYRDATGLHKRSQKISPDAIELTKFHVQLTEGYQQTKRVKSVKSELEADILYHLVLKYASQTNYEIASRLFSDLISDYPQSIYAHKFKESQNNFKSMWKTKKALFWKGSLLDHSGRTDVMIFSGYYGVWLGIATPIAFETDSPQVFALGLLLGSPLSLYTTYGLTKKANISDARATMICLGGHLGTWQGIGWAAVADMEGNQAVGFGELGGLLGIGAATILTNKIDFSTGHAGLTSSGLQWGAWAGLVLGSIFDSDDLLRDMLIGSDVFILGTALATKDVQMSSTRVRLLNLAGVMGAVLGFGIDIFAEIDDGSTAFAIAGLGSVAGLLIGKNMTKNFDKGKELSFLNNRQSHLNYALGKPGKLWKLSPYVTLKRFPYKSNKLIPFIGIQVSS